MRIIPIFVPHEGCPHDCVFCNQRHIAAEHSPTEDEAAGIIKKARQVTGSDAQVAYYGGSFTAIPAGRQEQLLNAAWKEGFSIRVSTRPDCIDEETLKRLKKYGVETIELGAQSMDDHVLRLAGRGHTSNDTRHASRLIKDAGFKLILQSMAGLPGDKDTLKYTARELAALKPDGIRIYPVVVIRDTALYDMWQRGNYTPLNVSEGADAAADMLEIFIENNIPVIRIGLNPTEELSGGSAVAGAYHPALGEMARSRIYLRRILDRTGNMHGALSVRVGEKFVSQAAGVGRENIERLKKLGFTKVKIIPCAGMPQYEVYTVLE